MRRLSGQKLMEDLGLPYFRNISTFGALSDATIVHLVSRAEVLALDAGDVLFEAGEPSEGFYVIIKGQLAFYKYHEGHYAFIRNYQSGENIGFVGMIALHRRIGRARAEEEVIVVKIPSSLFQGLYESDTQDFALLLMNLARDMARGLRAVDNLIVAQHQGDQQACAPRSACDADSPASPAAGSYASGSAKPAKMH